MARLVELLAKEFDVWPEGDHGNFGMSQDEDRGLNTLDEGCSPSFCANDLAWKGESHSYARCAQNGFLKTSELASDYATAVVTEAQWQAERDRQKGGEWKRHRGGWMPAGLAGMVEVKLRCGDIQRADSHALLWRHEDCDVAVNIMKYRVISQPQAEEVEMKKFCIGANCNATAESIVHSHECEAEHEASYVGVWAQSTGPLAWRDTIIHCQAIIEDCEREIQSNVNLLDSEGLFMQLEPKKGMQAYDVPAVDMRDWRNWKAGDLVTSKTDYNGQFTKDKKYSVTATSESYGSPRVNLDRDDKGEANGWTARNFEFHSRP